MEDAAKTLGKKQPTPPKELFTLLGIHHFPGNIRELQAMIFDAISRHKSGVLSMETFKTKIGHKQTNHKTPREGEKPTDSSGEQRILFTDQLPTLKETEQLLISEALKRANGNQTIAAQMLGMTRTALNNRLIRSRK